jgi:hypothetical protein
MGRFRRLPRRSANREGGSRQPMFDVQCSMLAAQSRPAVSGLDSSSLAWGKHPIAPGRFLALCSCPDDQSQEEGTDVWWFDRGRLRACGRQKAEGIVRLAVNARLAGFRGHDHFVILEPGPDKFFHSYE